jgi:diphthamide biosynthesis protein 2
MAHAAPWTTLADFYELDRSIAAVLRLGAKRVALQFPDAYLRDTVAVKERLQEGVGPDVRFFILGDTSYGSVHVDEVNAQHVCADLIIHYGAAHASATHRTPVQWILNKAPGPTPEAIVDVLRAQLVSLGSTERGDGDIGASNANASAATPSQSQMVVAFQSPYVYLRPAVEAAFADQPRICFGASVLDEFGFCRADDVRAPCTHDMADNRSSTDHAAAVCGSYFASPQQHTQDAQHPLNSEPNVLVYIGEQSDFADSLFLRFSRCVHRHMDPTSALPCGIAPRTDVNKVMMKRFFVIERLRRAASVGLVIGTLAIHRYAEVLQHVKAMLERCGKKPYVFVVGKINVAKLSNFGDIDAFVYIGGIDYSLLGNKDFPKVIATPFEASCAFGGRDWTGEYIVDFGELLVAEKERERLSPTQAPEVDEMPVVGGGLLAPNVNRSSTTSTHLVALHSPAAVMLQEKAYRGLEIDRANDAVDLATRGQFGIAREYTSERRTRDAGGLDNEPATQRPSRLHRSLAASLAQPVPAAQPSEAVVAPELSISGNALFDEADLSDVSSFDDEDEV